METIPTLQEKPADSGTHSVTASNKKGRKGVAPSRKKVKGAMKVCKRTTNLKKAKKVAGPREESLSDVGKDRDEGGGGREVRGRGDTTKDQRKASRRAERDSDGSPEEDKMEDVGEEEEEWARLQQSMQKHTKKKFEQRSTDSHPVHAPFFPEVRVAIAASSCSSSLPWGEVDLRCPLPSLREVWNTCVLGAPGVDVGVVRCPRITHNTPGQ